MLSTQITPTYGPDLMYTQLRGAAVTPQAQVTVQVCSPLVFSPGPVEDSDYEADRNPENTNQVRFVRFW
jgi:hypothetical protein